MFWLAIKASLIKHTKRVGFEFAKSLFF